MPKKEYSLLSTEPLTEFDNFMLRILKEMTAQGATPRAPISIERLHNVMRPSIDRLRTASPAYSTK